MGAGGEAELASPVMRLAPVVWSKKAPGVGLLNFGGPYQNPMSMHAQVLSKPACEIELGRLGEA
jgi:hypothetical protein